MNFLKLTPEQLNLNEINELVVHESCGGIAFFIGTTRDNFEDKKVLCLEYEAYDTMAIKSMTKICDEIRCKWSDIQNIAIYHRLGVVPVKEASVVIGVSSPHRKTCLDAVQFAIDELKKTVTIWKKEKYAEPEVLLLHPTKKFKKTATINFDDCPISSTPIVKNLIQIHADENELNRRINCFVDRKREEIDVNNINDFIVTNDEENCAEYSCARVNSSVFRKKDSNTHLEVQRVQNEYGPQTKHNYTNALDKLTTHHADESQLTNNIKQENDSTTTIKTSNISVPGGIKERLSNTEKYLNLTVKENSTLYERLKTIEDRIMYLEAISPEYKHFVNNNEMQPTSTEKVPEKKKHTTEDLEHFITELQQKVK